SSSHVNFFPTPSTVRLTPGHPSSKASGELPPIANKRHHGYVSNSRRRRGPQQEETQAPILSSEDHAIFTDLLSMKTRLHGLLVAEDERACAAAEEERHHRAVLEIQSRRRAWLNKALV